MSELLPTPHSIEEEEISPLETGNEEAEGADEGSFGPHDRKRKREDFADKFGNELCERSRHSFHDLEHGISNRSSETNLETMIEEEALSDGEIEQEEQLEETEDLDSEDIINEFDEERFFSSPSFSQQELLLVEPQVVQYIDKALKMMEDDGFTYYKTYWEKREQRKSRNQAAMEERNQQALQDCIIAGDPREYQRALFEIAKSKNTIVNLGTGFGKTLIALLCIRHFSRDFSEGKQTLFMVPSVALAIQQSMTLRANLPNFTVQTAYYARSNSETSRQALAKANVVVATHGAVRQNRLFSVRGCHRRTIFS